MKEISIAMTTHRATNGVRAERLAARVALLTALMCAALLATGAAARADFGVVPGSLFADAYKDDGSVESRAGVHPDHATTGFTLNTMTDPGGTWVDGSIKNARVTLPPGFVGSATAVPACPRAVFAVISDTAIPCPVETQVGVVALRLGGPGFISPVPGYGPIYNIEPRDGHPADFGFFVGPAPVHIESTIKNDGEYKLVANATNISHNLNLVQQAVEIWGVPWDESHDDQRLCLPPNGTTVGCETRSITGVAKPLLANPTSCGAPPKTEVAIVSWQDSGTFLEYEAFSQEGVTGCEILPFVPSLRAAPDATAPDSPTGLAVDLSFPQGGWESATGKVTAHLKRAKVTLPEGMTISPSAADGLQACSDEQIGIDNDAEPACPAGSKIGTVVAETPLLDVPLEGEVFIGTQRSDDPESGEMFRLFLVVQNKEKGILVKLPGQVRANAQTGRLETTFDNNPQLPVSQVSVRLRGGSRAPLVTPPTCGVKRIEAELTSWAGHAVTLADSFTVPCVGGGFAPSLTAGSVNAIGGEFSPFGVRIGRDDRQQFLSGVQVDLPEGLLAKLRGVPLCGSVQAEHGGCPAGSRIGTATAGAGPGSNPFYVQGDVFLTEGYKGGPYGLAVHVHAKAGPFDLGWVRVRQALYVDRVTAEVSAVSDPLPQIVKGVPVRLRDVRVDVDKQDFTVNPTSCSEQRVDATLTSIDGAAHRAGSRFQVGDCQALPFKPRLGLRLTGRKQVRTGRHPGVRAVVRQTGIGEAGIDRAKVTLPKSVALDPENAQALCEFEDGTKPDLENHCPKGSMVGRARATTPLLNRPLVGDVYFVKNVRRSASGNLIRTLPMIVVALRGEIAINLTGKSSTTKSGRLVNTFANVPDAPITRFNLNIKGGSNGILAVTRTRRARINLCARPKSHTADNDMDGQNGKRADYRVRVKTPCGRKARKAAQAKRGKSSRDKRGNRR